MKTFLNLGIGDIIYKIEVDSYRSKLRPQLTEIKVFKLEVDGSRFVVNKSLSYGDYTYLLQKPMEELECDILQFRDCILTTNIDHVKECLRDAGMMAIKYYESEIERNKQSIEDVRKSYFEYLNYK